MIFDSSVVIELLLNPSQVAVIPEPDGTTIVSVATVAETSAFLMRHRRPSSRAALVCRSLGTVVPVTEAIALHAGELHAQIRKTRPKFGMIDALILATAHEHKMQLVTFDTDFRGLPGVRILKRKR